MTILENYMTGDVGRALELLSKVEIAALEARVSEKSDKLYVRCLKRAKDVRVTPEEVVRQLWLDRLTTSYGYPLSRRRRRAGKDDRACNFDVLMANPPFAGDIKQSAMLDPYDLAHNAKNGRLEKAVGRDLLFIERNLDMLRPGGRMAVVLPQGRFNNASDKRLRDYIMERCRVLAVVGLHPNSFKPHTGTKTSVLFVQKWNGDPKLGPLCPKRDDYDIFFATKQRASKDNSGDKIHVIDPDGGWLRDDHGHFIVEHDLFNHEGKTRDGIAEASHEFARKEALSFFSKPLRQRPFCGVDGGAGGFGGGSVEGGRRQSCVPSRRRILPA